MLFSFMVCQYKKQPYDFYTEYKTSVVLSSLHFPPRFSHDLFLQVFSPENFSLSPHPGSKSLPNPRRPSSYLFHHSPYCCRKIYLLLVFLPPLPEDGDFAFLFMLYYLQY